MVLVHLQVHWARRLRVHYCKLLSFTGRHKDCSYVYKLLFSHGCVVEQVELALAVIGCNVLRDVVKALQKRIGNPVSAGAGRFQCGYCMGPRRPCPSHF